MPPPRWCPCGAPGEPRHRVPTLATVAGCAIRMYFDDHEPAHFHAVAPDGAEAVLRVSDLSIIMGDLSPSHRRAVLGWAAARQDALALAWLRCREGVNPGRIG